MDRRSRQQPAARQHQRGGAPAKSVRIGLLGGFRVRVGPRLVGKDRWRLRKARSLVKLLALSSGHRLHREQAMELLWPGLDPQSASNNLHQVLHAARRALEPSVTTGSGGASSGYLILRDEQILLCPDSALWVDVDAFEEAATTARHSGEPQAFGAAIDLYAGELLPEDRYEAWPEERRAQLEELHLSLLAELAALYEERGEYETAIEALGRWPRNPRAPPRARDSCDCTPCRGGRGRHWASTSGSGRPFPESSARSRGRRSRHCSKRSGPATSRPQASPKTLRRRGARASHAPRRARANAASRRTHRNPYRPRAGGRPPGRQGADQPPHSRRALYLRTHGGQPRAPHPHHSHLRLLA